MNTDFWILVPVGLSALARWRGALSQRGSKGLVVSLIRIHSVLLYKPGGLYADLCYLQLTHLTSGAPNTLGKLPCSISYPARYRGCRHAQIHTHTNFGIHSIHTHIHTHTHAHTHTHTHVTHTHTHTVMHVRRHTHAHTQTHVHTNAGTHTHSHKSLHTNRPIYKDSNMVWSV